MADTKVSALSAAASVADANEFPINEAGTSKKVTASQIATYVGAELFGGITGVVRSDAGTLTADADVTDIVAAASDTAAGKIEIAIQSEQETGTDATRAVTPGRQHYHPSAAKVWVTWTGNSTTINQSFNVASINDTNVGIAEVIIGTDFSADTYCGQITVDDTASANDTTNTTAASITTRAVGSCLVCSSQMTEGGTAAANPNDPDFWCFVAFGDQ